jgi:hypothetical protein
LNWSSTDPFTDLGGGAICVPGFTSGGTRDYNANYKVNHAPTVTTDNASVTVSEGATATNTGTWADQDGDTVTLSASVGTVIKQGNGNWNWSFGTTDGPTQSQTVTITASDGTLTDTTNFSLTVNNVTPVATAPANQTATQGVSKSFTLGSFTDPGADSPWTVTVNWGDGSANTTFTQTTTGTITAQTHTYSTTGNKTVSITVKDKDNATSAAVSFTVTVAPADTTAPVITVSTAAGDSVAASGWYNIASSGTDGVQVNVSASDASGVASLSCTDGASSVLSETYSPAASPKNESFTLVDGTHSISCTATDGLGNSGAGSGSSAMPVSYKIDQTLPTISGSPSPAANANGWNNTDVTVSFTCGDATSTIDTCTAPVTLSGDGAGQSATGTATDKAGNSKSATVSGINIDKTAPSIHFDGASPGPNGAGWNNSDVTLSWSCTDGGSGVVAGTVTKLISSEGEHQSDTGTCSDKAGNTKSSTDGDVNIDKTAPTISASRTPAANGNGWNNTDVTVQFACDDPVHGGTASGVVSCPADVTLTGEGANQSVTRTVFDKAGNSASATKDNINIDKTAPTIHFDGASPGPNGAGWNNSDVTLSWSCADELSGAASNSDTASITSEGEHQGATGHCTDKAGNTKSSTDGDVNIDKTAPTISASRAPAANGNGWNNTDVTVQFSCDDPVHGGTASGVVSCPADVTLSDEGANQSVTRTVFDNAGNSASATKDNINIDRTAPTISASRTPAANPNGWNNTDVTVQFSCDDPVHGGTASGVVSCPADVALTGEGANQSVTRTVFDKAGNSASATKDNINIDKTAPNLGITDNNAASYNVCGARPSKPGFNPSDALSGLDGSQGETWTTPTTPSGVGNYTYSAHAQDKAGNSASYGPKTYTVLYGAAFGGYLQPINADGSSRFKLGSTIPVKFQALCNGTPLASVTAKMYVMQGDNKPDPGVDEAISTAAATTGNLFRWTGSPDNQYIFNLSTKLGYVNPSPEPAINSFSQGTWTLKIGLDDGTFRSVNIQLVR